MDFYQILNAIHHSITLILHWSQEIEVNAACLSCCYEPL